MSADNICFLHGRLTRDPEYFDDPDPKKTRAKFTIAVDRGNKSRADADFFDCVAFGDAAKHIATYFKKGRGVIISGEINIDGYTDRDGIKRKSINIIVRAWSFDGSPRKDRDDAPAEQADPLAWANGSAADSFEAVEEDVPF